MKSQVLIPTAWDDDPMSSHSIPHAETETPLVDQPRESLPTHEGSSLLGGSHSASAATDTMTTSVCDTAKPSCTAWGRFINTVSSVNAAQVFRGVLGRGDHSMPSAQVLRHELIRTAACNPLIGDPKSWVDARIEQAAIRTLPKSMLEDPKSIIERATVDLLGEMLAFKKEEAFVVPPCWPDESRGGPRIPPEGLIGRGETTPVGVEAYNLTVVLNGLSQSRSSRTGNVETLSITGGLVTR